MSNRKKREALPRDLEIRGAEIFGKHLSPEKQRALLIVTLTACALPMILGVRMWDRIPEIVETGLIGPGGRGGPGTDYLTPLLYVISKPEKWTLSLAVGRMTSSTYGTQWNLFMAADVVYMLPILILFFFCQKYFMEGLGSLNSSGVKA